MRDFIIGNKGSGAQTPFLSKNNQMSSREQAPVKIFTF